MTELKNGLILTQSKVKNTKFTFNGKDIELKQDENNPLLYTARSSLTEDEKKAGNRDYEFFLNFGDAEGVVSVNILPPQLENDPEFKDLNDAEKLTKLNSIAYQYKTSEPTDIGKGLDEVLQTSVSTPQQNENFAEGKNKTATATATATTTASPTSSKKKGGSEATAAEDKVKSQEKPFPGQTGNEHY